MSDKTKHINKGASAMSNIDFNQSAESIVESLLAEKKWSAEVETKWEPKEGTFTGSAEEIANAISRHHKTLKGAVASLNFYRNRNPKNMSQSKHDEILGMLHTKFENK